MRKINIDSFFLKNAYSNKMKNSIHFTQKRLDSVSPTFCVNKWQFGVLDLEKSLSSMCYLTPRMKINESEVKENYKKILLSEYQAARKKEMLEGIRHSDCSNCWKAEDSGLRSDRIFHSHYQRNYFDKSIDSSWNKEYEPAIVELIFSSSCNFKCLYCGPSVSTRWRAEIEEFGVYQLDKDHTYQNTSTLQNAHHEGEATKEAFWRWWPELKTKIKQVKITGGEPLLHEETYTLIDSFIDSPAPNLLFSIHTNLGSPQTHVKKFCSQMDSIKNKIKSCTVFVSMEATEKRAEYIRYGLNWELFLNNLKILLLSESIQNISFNAALTCLSTPFFHEFIEFFESIKKTYPNKNILLLPNLVESPSFLSIENIPPHLREYWQKSEELFSKNKDTDMVPWSQIKEIGNRIRNSQTDQNRKHLKAYLLESDRRRNTSFNEVFPEYFL